MPLIDFHLNGRSTQVAADANTLLVHLLRDSLQLTGTHIGCDTAQCGACTVLLDGLSVKSCSVLALQVQGRTVTTIEGLANLSGLSDGLSDGLTGGLTDGLTDGRTGGTLHAVQEAFVACHGLQCGFCTPGMVMVATCLLSHNKAPSEDDIVQALEGNLCRCTGYVNIVAAVQQAALVMSKETA